MNPEPRNSELTTVANPVTLKTRPALDTDWDAAARVYSLAHPHEPLTGLDLRKRDEEQRAWGYQSGVLVALEGSGVVGMACYFQNPGAYHPHKFTLEMAVPPSLQGRGIGRALWTALEAELVARQAQSARTLAREDHPITPGFLSRRGFVGDKRYFTSALEVAGFDVAPYQALIEGLTAQGVSVLSLVDLQSQGVPNVPQRLHALMSDVRQDVPRAEPATPLSLQVFLEAVLGDPGLRPEAYLVAEKDGQFIGQTVLFASEASPDLFTGLTGVTREWRGRGIATRLKLAAIEVAKAYGAPYIRTDNASDNAPMLAINDKLGFVRDPASISYLWSSQQDQQAGRW